MEKIEEDDIILVIVGHDDVIMNNNKEVEMAWPMSVKQETLDPEETLAVEEILQKVVKHGEYLSIKKETEDEIESQENEENEFDMDENLLESDIYSDSCIPEYFQGKQSFRLKLFGKRSHMLMPSQRKSLVQQICKENPELKDNETLLVKHLTYLMRELKPPPPPAEYCEIINEDKDLKYMCIVCQFVVNTDNAALRHYNERHGKRYLTCFACGADFKAATNLYKHEKSCVAPDARVVLKARGQFLGRKGRSRPYLSDTKYEHNFAPKPKQKSDSNPDASSARKPRRKRYYCAQCPASFKHSANLDAHENSHAGIRPHRCDSCTAAYTSITSLRRHLQTHGDNTYICDHCGRSFNQRQLLISHLNTHNPIRKYGCEYCARRFSQKNALVHHVNTGHLRLPAACECPVCPKRFARRSHVKSHMNKKHGLSMYTRQMFFKDLPNMTEIEVKDAKLVLSKD